MKKLINLALIVVGLAFEAFAVTAFIIPNHFLIGGITGLGSCLHNYFGLDIPIAVGIMSIALLIIAWLSLGTKFALTIVFGSILFPLFLRLMQHWEAITHLTTNPVVASVFGGSLVGIGIGMVIKAGSSSGGSDVIPVILNRKFGWPLAPMIYATDTIILLLQCAFSSSEEILLGIMLIFLSTVMLNKVILIGSQDVQFMIMSNKYEEINDVLQNKLNVGTTKIHSTSGHLNNDTRIILCITSPENVSKVKSTVLDIDEEAFMTMINVNDVRGQGFSMGRIHPL